METAFKNSYKVQDKEMVSLSVYNVGYQFCEPNHTWGPGVRDHYLIHYIVSGKGYYQCNEKTYPLKTGDVFIIFPNTKVTYQADDKDPWEYYWVGFSGSDAAIILEATDFSKEVPVIRNCHFGSQVKASLLEIYKARGNDLNSAVKMTGLLYLTLSNFLTGSNKKSHQHSLMIDYVQKGITYIESHFSYPISIDEVADYVGISRSHLFREFKTRIGKSPKEYLTDYRIKYSCHLLKTTDLSVQSIAISVGYEDSLYYSKVFHHCKGVTPTQYRKLSANV